MTTILDVFDEKSSSYLANKRWFTEFLEKEWSDTSPTYGQRIPNMLDSDRTRLFIHLSHLREYDNLLTQQFLLHPIQYIAPFQSALRDYVRMLDHASLQKLDLNTIDFTIGVEGNFGRHHVSPRELNATHLNTLMCVDGIATRCSIVRPKVKRTVHYCEEDNTHTEQVYHDVTSLIGFPTGSVYPTKNAAGHALSTEYGLSQYIDHQSLCLHEMPERTPAGLLPSSVDVILDDDLVDKCKPGDRIQIIGIYRSIPSKGNGNTNGLFRTVLIANSVKLLSRAQSSSMITEKDVQNIRRIAKNRDYFGILANSIAPSIEGHPEIKKALLLQLLGGCEKNLENGTHIRGDINILMCGDPSTAKSQLLRFILSIAPLAINTTGRGSSGVGLTAAVLTDRETGERRLEAGAMVLADRGIVCIDEFDKMSDGDRVAIHEVMEQQTVTIAKAGIHMSLNARCSVLAAANPRYSQYDSTHTPAENVALPDSLLSRFDLLFIVLDTPDKDKDSMIADRVIRNHRYLTANVLGMDDDDLEVDPSEMDNSDPSNHNTIPRSTPVYANDYGKKASQASSQRGDQAASLDCLSIPFLKKYIEFAKEMQPVLTDGAAMYISTAYSKLRSGGDRKKAALPVTARTLETMIRLSTAHAKARLSTEVTEDDCEDALDIMQFALNNDTGVTKKLKASKHAARSVDTDMDAEAEKDFVEEEKTQEDDTSAVERNGSTARRQKKQAAAKKVAVDMQISMDVDEEAQPSAAKRARRGKADSTISRSSSIIEESKEAEAEEDTVVVNLSPERMALFKRLLGRVMNERRLDDEQLDILLPAINSKIDSASGEANFTREDAEAFLQLLAAQNLVMYTEGRVWKM